MIVNVHEAKTHLSRLLVRVANGEKIIIAKSGKPVATLSPFVGAKQPRKPGAWKGKVWKAPDFDDFDREIEKMFLGEEDDQSSS